MKIFLVSIIFSAVIWLTAAADSSTPLIQGNKDSEFNVEDFMPLDDLVEAGGYEDSEIDIEKIENVDYEVENDNDEQQQEPEVVSETEDRQENFKEGDESLEQDETTEEEVDDNQDLEDTFEKFEQLEDDISEDNDELDSGYSSLNSIEHWKNKNTKKKPIKLFRVWVTLSTKSSAYIYHNRHLIGAVRNWTHVRTFKLNARRRDTIGIISSGPRAYHGIVAAIKVAFTRRNRLYVTGRSKLFKAVAVSKVSVKDRRLWRNPSFKTCHWKRPINVRPQKGKRFAKTFPFKKFNAKYVWTQGERKGEAVFIRFQLFGEKCKQTKPIPRKGPKRCACRPVKTKIKGECYEFTNHNMLKTFNRSSRCEKRNCTQSYECVSSRRKTKLLCVRRFATSEVRIVGRVFKRVCKNVRVRPRRAFYVPYEK